MMRFDRITLGRQAKELGFVRDTFEKVCRLADDCTSYSESRAEHKEIQDCYSDMYNIRFCTGTACLCAVF